MRAALSANFPHPVDLGWGQVAAKASGRLTEALGRDPATTGPPAAEGCQRRATGLEKQKREGKGRFPPQGHSRGQRIRLRSAECGSACQKSGIAWAFMVPPSFVTTTTHRASFPESFTVVWRWLFDRQPKPSLRERFLEQRVVDLIAEEIEEAEAAAKQGEG